MNQEVNWIIKITDKVTAPIKKMQAELRQSHKGFDDNAKASDKVGSSINDLKKKLNSLSANRDKQFSVDKIRQYNAYIKKTEAELKKLEDLPPSKHKENWASLALGLNQTIELTEKLASSLSFTTEINQFSANLKRMTGLQGDALGDAKVSALQIAEIYGQAPEDVLRAANAMSKNLGGTFEDNLSIINKGFMAGADLNGDFLSSMSEYSVKIKDMGMTASQSVALITQANKEGIFSDKAIDALKEGDLALKEMDKAQVDALAGIGIHVKDLSGKTGLEAMQMISKSMDGFSTAAKQKVIADVFKGAGEDAGEGWIEGLHTVNMDLDSMPLVEETNAGMTRFMTSLKVLMSDSLSGVMPLITGFAHLGTAIGTITTLTSALSIASLKKTAIDIKSGIVTKFLAAKQWALNIAMNAGAVAMWAFSLPVLAVIAAIGLLAAGVIWAYNEFEGFRNVIDAIIAPLKLAYEWVTNLFGAVDGADGEVSVDVKKKVSVEEEANTANDSILGGVTNLISPSADSTSQASPSVFQKTPSSPSSSSLSGGGGGKSVTVKIENLVNQLTISTKNMTESNAKIKEKVTEALVGAVRDFEVSIG